MSNYLWILDNGHGGLIDGVYQTKGKRSPRFEDGRIVYEGVFNRAVVKALTPMLDEACIDYEVLVDTDEDVRLSARTTQANEMAARFGKSIYLSIHANAHTEEWNSANGLETFHFEKDGRVSAGGKKLAEYFQPELVAATNLRDRGVKGANFHVLRETSMPSVLTENGFMTNRNEAELMLTDGFVIAVATAHFKAIEQIEKDQPV